MLVAVSLAVHADDGPARLRAFLSGLETLSADFEQTVRDENLRALETSRGDVRLARPGRFRWTYREPFAQVIVADGEQVWIYDEDLAQVTVQPLGETLGSTPALLLSSDRGVDEDFVVTAAEPSEGLVWAELEPRATQASFNRIRFGFADGGLRRMDLADAFGNQTRIVFSGVRRNVELDADSFRFVPPPGVDVIDNRARPSPGEAVAPVR